MHRVGAYRPGLGRPGSLGQCHSLDAEMPRHLTPCKLWQLNRGRCGSPATPPLRRRRPTGRAASSNTGNRNGFPAVLGIGPRACWILKFAAPSLKEGGGIPEARPNSIVEADDGCRATRCQTLLPLAMSSPPPMVRQTILMPQSPGPSSPPSYRSSINDWLASAWEKRPIPC
jgi:hypothetical protein